MITLISGRVHSVQADSLVVVTAGIGRRIHVTPSAAADARAGGDIELHTVLVVREDSLTLFGFSDEAERDLFEILQTISGIGPRLALAVLSVFAPAELHEAISAGDQKALTRVPGIGAKVAARIMLELTGKLDRLPVPAGASPVAAEPGGRGPAAAQVVDALVGLGWKQAAAESAVDDTLAVLDEPTVPELLKATLRSLGART